MTKSNTILWIGSIILLAGCVNKSDHIFELIPTSSKNTISFSSLEEQYTYTNFYWNDSLYGAILDFTDSCLKAKSFPSGKEACSVRLSAFFKEHRKALTDFAYCMVNPDTVFALFNGTATVFQLDKNGHTDRTIPVQVKLRNDSLNFVLQSFFQVPMEYDGEHLIVPIVVQDFRDTTPYGVRLRQFYASPPDIFLRIEKDAVRYEYAIPSWPESYKGDINYHDDCQRRAVSGPQKVAYSFAADHSVYLYDNFKLVKMSRCKSKYLPEQFTEFPKDSILNISYMKKFMLTRGVYDKLDYDRFRKVYYRVVLHPMPYQSKDGMTVNGWESKPWSIQVIDENLNLLNELKMDPAKYTASTLMITKEGVYIKNAGDGLNVEMTLFKAEQ